MFSRIVLILVLALGLVGCGSSHAAGGRTTVVAAFYPLAYAADRIGGARVDVENLTPAGAEPHDIELAPQAVARIKSADVVLYLSHGFQPAVEHAVGSNGVDLLAGLPLRPGDPHVWLDPVLFARIAKRIGRALHRSPRPLLVDLRRLDRAYRTGLAHCTHREIVTTHKAFGYLSQRYGLTQVPISGITPEAEPTPQQLARVVHTVRRTHATTVFTEPLVSPRIADTVARETGARTAVLDPIESATNNDTYLTLMRQNLAALRKALGCR